MLYRIRQDDGFDFRELVWEFPSSTGEWREHAGCPYGGTAPGPLSREGKVMLLKHFGLQDALFETPCFNVSLISPAKLLHLRRALEGSDKALSRLEPVGLDGVSAEAMPVV